jgi:ArsR family metal-binding transcriptional regulator
MMKCKKCGESLDYLFCLALLGGKGSATKCALDGAEHDLETIKDEITPTKSIH